MDIRLFEYEAASALFANALDNDEPQLKLVQSKRSGMSRGRVVAASRAPAGASPDGEPRRDRKFVDSDATVQSRN